MQPRINHSHLLHPRHHSRFDAEFGIQVTVGYGLVRDGIRLNRLVVDAEWVVVRKSQLGIPKARCIRLGSQTGPLRAIYTSKSTPVKHLMPGQFRSFQLSGCEHF